jgi:hypothetical protein
VLPALSLDNTLLEGTEDEKAEMFFSYGTLYAEAKQTKKRSENVFLQESSQLPVELQTFTNRTEFRQSNQSREFVRTDEDETSQQGYIKMGSILHHVFSTIRTTDDITSALQQLEQEGVLYDEDITAAKVTALLRKRLEDPRVRDWFSNKWTLYNECAILFTDATGKVVERRPDRVMSDGQKMVVVDFKFGRPRPEYQEQVHQYMQLLHEMGHSEVEGYLWYVYSNKIEKVS